MTSLDYGLPSQHRHRLERKYTLPVQLAAEIEARLRLRPHGLRQVYPPRHVNNLYFDSPTRRRYLDKIEGEERRVKVRIRWYGDFWGRVENPALELKTRNGHAGAKHRFSLPDFDLARCTRRDDLAALLKVEDGHAYLRPQPLEAVLATRYLRRYYGSSDQNVRLTLDREVLYLRAPGPRGFTSRWRRDGRVVAELKYGPDQEPRGQELAQWLGLRLIRNSKFALGLEATRF